MARIVHARLDPETEKLFADLERRLGWSDSKIIREAIKALGVLSRSKPNRRIVGMGRFCSGVPDLGSNKKHLKGFGQ